MNLGLIGLDTSHCSAFARYLLDAQGINITAAWPGGSAGIPMSFNRVQGFTRDIATLGIPILESPEAVARVSDAVMILSMEGAKHRSQFERILRPGLRIFIDKPMADTVADTKAIYAKAAAAGASVFSASALRFLPAFRQLLKKIKPGGSRKICLRAPLNTPEGMPRYHFYGIHAVELLIAALGPDWRTVEKTDASGMAFQIQWQDGANAELIFTDPVNTVFSLLVEHEGAVEEISDLRSGVTPLHAPLLEEVKAFFLGAASPVGPDETVSGIRLLEALDKLDKPSEGTKAEVSRTSFPEKQG